TRYQYYQFYNTERREGNTLVHSFHHEYSAVVALARAGYLKLCTSSSPRDCGNQTSTLTIPSRDFAQRK
ncbi:hypothetical protein CYMTET_56168, partial [Cymbomonas tetramitiformis]